MKMKLLLLKVSCLTLVILFAFSSLHLHAQNIFSGEPVQVTGSMNSYGTSAAANATYRRITTTIGNPTDGRGQWVKTYNAQVTGGDVSNSNMAGGSNAGFLFISGPSTNRFQNKWVFNTVVQARRDSINIADAYNTGQDMGLNMSTAGRYTFVFNDCGYTNVNARYYVGYTLNNPVTPTNVSHSVQVNNNVLVNITTSAAPSPGERVFVRFTSAATFASTSTTTILEATSINTPANTTWQAIIPSQAPGTSIRYYAFTSTLPLSRLNQLTELDRTLCGLQVNDNGGNNYVVAFAPKYNVTFSVDVTNSNCSGIDSVTVTGSVAALSMWSNGYKLNRAGTTNVYNRILQLDSGVAVEYKFRFHSNGATNWEGTFSTPSGNRELVPIKDSTLSIPCFGATSACAPIPPPSTITFAVNLTGQSPDPLGRIYVIGNFRTATWVSGAIRMTPVAGLPNHFQAIVNNVCPASFEYKFVNGDSSVIANHETFPNPAHRACVISNGLGGFNRVYNRVNANPVLLGFVYNSCNTALPVQFLNISAYRQEAGVIIDWATASETNNRGFFIQKSINGVDFEDIGFVEGEGDSKTQRDYSFYDKDANQFIYYRIKQVDYDETFAYSKVVTVQTLTSDLNLRVFPIPFKDKIKLQFNEEMAGNISWSLFNANGMLLQEGEQNKTTFFELNGLAAYQSGVYYMKVQCGNITKTVKLIK
jgi:hypothetical protein